MTVFGVSEAAQTLDSVREYESSRSDETVTFSNQSLHDQLIDVFCAALEDGWEGEGSCAVSRQTLAIAKLLVDSLPLAFRTPAITGEPDGHVCLEWYVHPRRVLTVSLSSEGVLHWAALVGEEDPRGSCRFYGELPKTLEFWIKRVCSG